MAFSRDSIRIDPAAETERIVSALRRIVLKEMRRAGGVVGVSGGVDSAVALALAVRAFGAGKVTPVMMPEKDSDPLSERLAREQCACFGVQPLLETITPALEGFGCYRRRDDAVRRVFPEFDSARGWKVKITLPPDLLGGGTFNLFSVAVTAPDGRAMSKPLASAEFLQIVAASNFKQRSRMAMVYYHAESRHYAVIGTANKNEHDQGFIVKYGDVGVDVATIAHLYKSQVYQLADYLGVTREIRERTPTSDTYSAPCDQQEFFFRLPFAQMDLLWYAQEHNVPIAEVTQVTGLTEAQVKRAFADFMQKHRTTDYLRWPAKEIE